jgi:DNA-binding ferritin-like protein
MTEFENATFKEGELVDEFSMRIESLAENLRALGESITDACVAKKMLRVLPKKFSQIAASIETLLDINSLTFEDLVSRLKPSEDRATIDSITEQSSWLLLIEEEWLSKYHHH